MVGKRTRENKKKREDIKQQGYKKSELTVAQVRARPVAHPFRRQRTAHTRNTKQRTHHLRGVV
jgi:hypothetical protein